MNVVDYKKLEQTKSDSNNKYFNLTVSYTIKRALESNIIHTQTSSIHDKHPMLAQLYRSSDS